MNYDMIIIGGGINGVAIARECSNQGKNVLLIERHTIGSGTSSKSSRLIHGGLRYLEHGHFSLVREALNDRTRLCERYPDLVQMRPFLLPVYRSSQRKSWIIRLGLGLYDWFSRFIAPHRSISARECIKRYGLLKPDGLLHAYIYFDAKTDDLELTRKIASDAVASGCRIVEACEVNTIKHDTLRYTLTTSYGDFTAPILINATGPWIDEVNERFNLPARYEIQKVSGIHIVLDKLLCDEPILLQAAHERVFFIIPENTRNQTIIGTTERLESLSVDDIAVKEVDVAYLIDEVNHYLQIPIKREDVIDTYIGVRPIVHSHHSIGKASREYVLDTHHLGETTLVHIFGGKLTTHWSLAEKILKKLGY